MQYDEKIVKAALCLIIDAVAEDKQQLTKETEMLKAENSELKQIANKYILKCDELTFENKQLAALRTPIRPPRRKESEGTE